MSQAPQNFVTRLAAMTGICLVIMLIAIDSTVVGTAMPRIVAELEGYALYPWIASAYLMTNAVMIPITGRLGDLYGRKYFVIVAVILFTLASALCGMAQSMLQLVLARGLQGAGGGMLVGVAFASVPDIFPDRLQRVRWQAMLSASFGIASAIGPSLGGWLTEHAGWRSVFYVNLPVALLALPVIWRYLPRIVHHEGDDKGIDWVGALLLAAALCSLLLATEHGQAHGLLHLQVLVLGVAALLLGAAFIWHQHHSRAPIVPAEMFANRDVRKLAALGVLTGFSMFVLVFYAPLLLQGSFGLSPATAGFVLTPLLVSITVGSIINGRLLPRLARPERLIAWGQLLLCVSCLALTAVDRDSPRWLLMGLLASCGLSLGFQLPNLTLQMMAVVGRLHLGVGTAMVQTTRMLGSMVGVSIAGVIVNAAFAQRIQQALLTSDLQSGEVVRLMGSPQVLVRAEDQTHLAALAQQQGFDMTALLHQAQAGLAHGIHIAFVVAAVLAMLGVLISLRLPRYVVTPAQAS